MLEFIITNIVVCRTVEAMLFASIACAVLGVIITQVQISSIGFTMSHAAFAGAAIGIFFSINATLSAIIASICVAFLIGPLSDKAKVSADTALGLLFGICMALAIFFIAYMTMLGRGFSAMGLMFGNVISLYREDVYLLALVCLVSVAFVAILYKEITCIIFNKKIAESVGIRVRPIYYVLLFVIALTVALCLPIVGGLLLYIWLITPAAIALQFCTKLSSMFIVAPIVGAIISISGAVIGLECSLPVGPLIAVFFSFILVFSVILSPKRRITKEKL
ncbi:ABC-3 [Methanospirillum hungatei JF-1]|jgi:zinc/manganese transport system permease protein|uniref:ABC-3 n=1 Tax=Methanospirillum hungatei JF-1 (strain ATCC 27890 / DSM 864 / NBRC 100397 / JF-1) TaxID=323259 RepID=Q2FMX6_METHJ|nr:metal ABC transporter permease [Methanospirillum hungatei]ABD40065.1 ABC-3 [Methanospirillum hungatei JF-1]